MGERGRAFTADPITGRRRRAAIEAVRGLGEQLVSGAVNPDHFIVDTAMGTVLERRGTSSATFTRELAAVGASIKSTLARPQDIEWAIDKAGKLWVCSPATSPRSIRFRRPRPRTRNDLRVYFFGERRQGGWIHSRRWACRPSGSSVRDSPLRSAPVRDPTAGASLYAESGMRCSSI